tara:strand:+ start:43028 stop:44527 length:1500 start_codon:yes stop_codon:yes gene_type:complete
MNTKEFLKISEQFKLGELDTEKPHPLTVGLSDQTKLNLNDAIETFKKVDLHALDVLVNSFGSIEKLQQDIQKTIHDGGRVFLCGCGATGRLSLALETISYQVKKLEGRVISFMAGGDVALIRSIEKFEDYPEYGKRQLLELGFGEKDLLIAITEGGETPFVIGACETASKLSKYSPYFCYCNPDEILLKKVERSKRVIENKKIKKLNLSHGPQALSGSTRLQCSTVLMAAVGTALFEEQNSINSSLSHLKDFYQFQSLDFLQDFIIKESGIYQKNEYVNYCTETIFGIDLLTDTTERSPTFSLTPFENYDVEKDSPSKSYLMMASQKDSSSAWKSLLYREPRVLEWEETKDRTGRERLLGFDFSRVGAKKRMIKLDAKSHNFTVSKVDHLITFTFDELQSFIDVKGLSLLNQHLIVKMILNMHSTLLMGRIDRYQSNIMVWVKASNNKLIDRAARYIDHLLKEKSIKRSYEEIVEEIFKYKDGLAQDQSIVLKVVKELS